MTGLPERAIIKTYMFAMWMVRSLRKIKNRMVRCDTCGDTGKIGMYVEGSAEAAGPNQRYISCYQCGRGQATLGLGKE